MADLPNLFTAIERLIWPLLVVAALIVFGSPVRQILKSIGTRRFKIKIGGTEVEVADLTKQQNALLSDLQQEVARIKNALGSNVATLARRESEARRILWVDDSPANNASAASTISSAGFRIDHALSTSQGLNLFSRNHYDFVISDMGRKEGNRYNYTAGLDLIEQIRAQDQKTPIIIYTTYRSLQRHGDRARGLGATRVTTSPTEVMETLIQ